MDWKMEEDRLFEEWEQARSNYKSFDRDGIVNPQVWEQTEPKVIFVLKETNDLRGDLRTFLANGGSKTFYRTWNNIVRWAEIVLYGTYSTKLTQKRRDEILPHICAINLKKESGGERSNKGEIRLAAKDDKDYIKRQIALYQPDLVITCGFDLVGDTLKNIVYYEESAEWKNDINELYYYESRLINQSKKIYVISMPHPNRADINKWCNELDELYHKLK